MVFNLILKLSHYSTVLIPQKTIYDACLTDDGNRLSPPLLPIHDGF